MISDDISNDIRMHHRERRIIERGIRKRDFKLRIYEG